ncbi:MAG: PAS domain-containing protein, partial [Desulfuromonadales bacterium]|nr:PAS domain-containing protein [Desulfuromonadales bacterium]
PQVELAATLPFPLVGIGASAGGLKALERFFDHLPPDSGMAFVVVQHLDPRRESYLGSLLQSHTAMAVRTIEGGMLAAVNTVYIKPPNSSLTIRHGRFHLQQPAVHAGVRLDIDEFFDSLAQDQGENAIAIVLSGAASDGTKGVRAINAADGLVLAQETEEAEYDSMPSHAIKTGVVDLVLPVEKMGEELARYVRHSRTARREVRRQITGKRFDGPLQQVLTTVQRVTGHDFSHYKKNTVRRRIERRLAIHQLDRLADYVRFIGEHPQEVEALFKDLLINVTSFFRDPKAFGALGEELAAMLAEHEPERLVRVWVPGCATGEEAYTLAILLLETMEKLKQSFPVKIYATDINPQSIECGREGRYPESIAADLSEERLGHFFLRQGNDFRVSEQLREMTVFAVHDLTRDPPFSRLDLVSCRNLLIYMDSALQKKVVPLLHYGLRPGGLLLLGTSEEVGPFTEEHFVAVNRKWKLFRARPLSPAGRHPIPVLTLPPRFREETGRKQEKKQLPSPAPAVDRGRSSRETALRQLVETTIMEEYAPPGIVVDERDRVLYFQGDTGRFLSPPRGEPSFELLKMARGGLADILAELLPKARQEKRRLVHKGVSIPLHGFPLTLDVAVKPLVEAGPGALLVTFEKLDAEAGAVGSADAPPDARIAILERQLFAARQELQATIEELETANEGLQNANEELQANNEELQSTNEELETSREELQSTNEELETVNVELKRKNDDLAQTSDDIDNLFSATDIGTVILDTDLRIKRFTPAATRYFRLIPSDIGRPLTDVVSSLTYEEMEADLQEVLRTLKSDSREVRSRSDEWYAVHLVPYRTRENVIAGVILTFTSVTGLKQAEIEAREAREFAENILATLREPLLVLNGELQVVSASPAFYRAFQVSPRVTVDVPVFQLGNNQWDIPELRHLLQEIIPENTTFNDFQVTHDFPSIGRRTLLLNARRLDRDGKPRLILLAFQDVTESLQHQGRR